MAHELELEQFLKAGFVDPLVKSRIWNNQTWQLSQGYGNLDGCGLSKYNSNELIDMAISHLSNFSHIGFTETFEDDLNIILPNLCIQTRRETVHTNVTKDRLYSNHLPSTTLEILEELTVLDRSLYQYAWSHRNL